MGSNTYSRERGEWVAYIFLINLGAKLSSIVWRWVES